jgi:hypothetical protein
VTTNYPNRQRLRFTISRVGLTKASANSIGPHEFKPLQTSFRQKIRHGLITARPLAVIVKHDETADYDFVV